MYSTIELCNSTGRPRRLVVEHICSSLAQLPLAAPLLEVLRTDGLRAGILATLQVFAASMCVVCYTQSTPLGRSLSFSLGALTLYAGVKKGRGISRSVAALGLFKDQYLEVMVVVRSAAQALATSLQ